MSSCEKSNILTWSTEEIRLNLTFVSNNVKNNIIANDDEANLELICFTYAKILPIAPITEWESMFLESITRSTIEIFSNTLQNIEHMKDVTLTQTATQSEPLGVGHLLQICCRILTSVRETCISMLRQCSDFNYQHVKSFIVAVDSIETAAFQHYWDSSKEQKPSSALVEFFKLTIEVHTFLVDILTKRSELANPTIHLDDDEFIQSFGHQLAKRAVLALDLEAGIMAGIWKGLLGVLERYQDLLKINIGVTLGLNQLCRRLILNIEQILSGAGNNQLVKISKFQLTVLVKLCRLLEDSLSDNMESIIRLLLILFR